MYTEKHTEFSKLDYIIGKECVGEEIIYIYMKIYICLYIKIYITHIYLYIYKSVNKILNSMALSTESPL